MVGWGVWLGVGKVDFKSWSYWMSNDGGMKDLLAAEELEFWSSYDGVDSHVRGGKWVNLFVLTQTWFASWPSVHEDRVRRV